MVKIIGRFLSDDPKTSFSVGHLRHKQASIDGVFCLMASEALTSLPVLHPRKHRFYCILEASLLHLNSKYQDSLLELLALIDKQSMSSTSIY